MTSIKYGQEVRKFDVKGGIFLFTSNVLELTRPTFLISSSTNWIYFYNIKSYNMDSVTQGAWPGKALFFFFPLSPICVKFFI